MYAVLRRTIWGLRGSRHERRATTQTSYQLQKTGDAPPELKRVEVPVREPGEHEVLVRVRAVSLNRRDVYVKLGRYPGPMPPNLVPLSDGAGEVVAIGPKATRFKNGDRVASIFFQHWLEGRFKPEYIASALGGGRRRHVVAVRDAERKRTGRDPETPVLTRKPPPCPAPASRPGTDWSRAVIRSPVISCCCRALAACPFSDCSSRRRWAPSRHHQLLGRQTRARQANGRGRGHQLQDHAGLGQGGARGHRRRRAAGARSRRQTNFGQDAGVAVVGGHVALIGGSERIRRRHSLRMR